MSKRWVLGLAAAITVVAVAGVGFSAFTTTAIVNGNATAATVSLTVAPGGYTGCWWLNNGSTYYEGTITQTAVSSSQVTFTVGNLIPGTYCGGFVYVTNGGSVELNLTNTLTGTGLCTPTVTTNCYWVTGVGGALNSAAGYWSYNNPTLYPGVYFDNYYIGIPAGSTTAPATGSFTATYVATAGL